MELMKLDLAEIVAFPLARLREVEVELRRELLKLRMDIYAEKGKHTAAMRRLRKTLARVKTCQNVKKG